MPRRKLLEPPPRVRSGPIIGTRSGAGGQSLPSKQPRRQAALLDPAESCPVVRRIRPRRVAALSMPAITLPSRKTRKASTALSALGPGVPPTVAGALTASDVVSDGTSTDASGGGPVASKRERVLRQNRASYRRRVYAAIAAEVVDGGRLTMLETQAVRRKTKLKYAAALAACRLWVRSRGFRMVNDTEIDKALVTYMDHHYFKGFQSHLGETVMSAFIDANPSFGKYGVRRTPRSWRALRAWRRLTPSRSRRPWPLFVWAALAVTLVLRGFRDMAIFMLLGLGTYARPSELLGLRQKDLIPPVRGVSRFGSLLIAPAEIEATTKTGESDDSVLLDCAWMPWLDRLGSELGSSQTSPTSPVFSFDYPAFCQQFQKALLEMEMGHLGVVPYAWRHSGPSIDRAQGRRTLQEVQKRGRWRQPKSVNRYEKAGRLGMSVRELTSEQMAFCELAEKHLGDFICGRRTPLYRFRHGA